MLNNNNGSTVIEDCVTIPLFLFFMLFVINVYRMIYVDAHIHQSLCEASIYCAQKCYAEEKMLSKNDEETSGHGINFLAQTAIINAGFRKNLCNDSLVEQVVAGGKNGIVITILPDADNPKIFIAKANYLNRVNIPILADFTIRRELSVKQKAFLGYDKYDEQNEDATYVYVTPNESVYHLDRNCSHLKITIHEVAGHGGYEACGFCGKSEGGDRKYITDSGNVYHNNIKCQGLKRTVSRVKKSSVSALSPCTRCGR